jgi:hypothetical protein
MDNAEFEREWNTLKNAEDELKTDRIKLEKQFLLSHPRLNTIGSVKIDGTDITVTSRLDHNVDGDKLHTLAAEAGLEEHLPALFRWKPELNIKAWEATDRTITDKLAQAITTKPAKPSFKINNKKED